MSLPKLYVDHKTMQVYLDGWPVPGVVAVNIEARLDQQQRITMEIIAELAGPESLQVDQKWMRVP